MPHLSIIPAAAVADAAVTDAHLRVLCAIGTFANKLGGNVWASVATMAKAANLNERSVQRALPALIERGYLRKLERPGKTSIYEIILQQGVTLESPGGDTGVGGGVTLESPKRPRLNDKINDREAQIRKDASAVLVEVWKVFPKRDVPHLYPPALKAVMVLLRSGATPAQLIGAAGEYAAYAAAQGTTPRYIKTISKFYADGAWEGFTPVTRVYGRTREEWARSGQDVAEFDRLAGAGR